MNNRIILFTTLCITGALLSTLWAQELTLKATGNGTLTDSSGKAYAASFEMWDDGESRTFIKISAPDTGQRGLQITISSFSADGQSARGTMMPCDGGGCPCSLQVNDAQSNLSGTCTNPDRETLYLSFPGFRRP